MSRPRLLARAKELRRLLDAARKTTIDVLRYDVGQLYNAVLTICRDAPDHLAALKKDADARRRDGEGPMNSAIVELLREVVRAAGGPRYRDVIILLGAVGVQSSEGALRQLALRSGLSRPRPKRSPKPRAPRGRPRNPNAVRNKGKRTITMGTGEEVHDAARMSRRGGRRDLDHDD